MQTIIRSAKGSARRQVDVSSIQIPDLWHIAMWLKENEAQLSMHNHLNGMGYGDAVLETWHLCHDLLANLQTDGNL